MSALDLDGATVTVFGDRDVLGRAINDELGRRGCNTHHVPVATGWLRSATHAVVRVDSRSGAEALRQLAARDHPRSHVVAVCAATSDAVDHDRVDELCRACGVAHDISLIWHEPFDHSVTPGDDPIRRTTPSHGLAAAIADEVVHGADPYSGPGFASHVFAPDTGGA